LPIDESLLVEGPDVVFGCFGRVAENQLEMGLAAMVSAPSLEMVPM
jgi:hypothetical protein